MKIKDLIKQLQKLDTERIIIISSDSEGNSYSPLCDISEGSYEADSTWSGNYGLEKLSKEDKEDGYTEEDIINGEKAICLHPIN